ncbi:MAG: hypothetical protein KKB70_06990 [Proteobacteria bacterium]|nr:hypothetical protein [Pseudomonadota bacterium]
MATSVIEICNNALQDLGEDTITSLTDNNKCARLCNQRWRATRDAVLRAHPWNCAMSQEELPASTIAPVWKWDYQFQLPADFLRIVRVVNSEEREISNWEVQGKIILCDEEAPLYISYIRREIDPQQYDALLSEALSARMSAALAYPLTGSTSLAQAFWDIYREKTLEARGVDAREGVPESIVPNSWITAKLGR